MGAGGWVPAFGSQRLGAGVWVPSFGCRRLGAVTFGCRNVWVPNIKNKIFRFLILNLLKTINRQYFIITQKLHLKTLIIRNYILNRTKIFYQNILPIYPSCIELIRI